MKPIPLFLLAISFHLNIVTVALAAPPVPTFRAVDVDPAIQIGYGLVIADVDGDKKPDIVLADKKQFVWYRNPGWERHVLAENLTRNDNVCIAARDLDGDGKVEIAVGGEWNPGNTVDSGSVHYLVPPQDRTRKWEAIALPNEPTVHRMRWVRNWQNEFELVVLPLHGRGNRNGEGAGVKILAYSRPNDPSQPWPTRTLADTLHKTHNFDPVQWDDDDAEESLIASAEGVFVVNWEDGELRAVQVTGNDAGGAGEVRLGQLKGGARFIAAIEPLHGTHAVIYTPSDDMLWSRNVIDSSFNQGHAVACGDFIGLGSDQVVFGWRNKNGEGKVGIALFTPLDGEGKEWRKTVVDDNTMACEDLQLGDINGDGRLDIVAAGRDTRNVKVYFNETPR